ncbi:LysR family transcriptional regulator [Vibrio sp. SCSIO 43136]|uniref:LysR family transcriptional regulator n=1 Tax=Vibrio sp. SCSIO 43136 TaxID=2819101 RepID=UPI00207529CE|nr:LysR family transcriptional regulator [Vibrio sp. SCSIO 43136]USD63972.1 LysR family transcriptional regulator [Vibrio sp. SCSIO 43136]
MDSRSLRYFAAVAEHKNITHAAKAVCIAQPALSIAIKKLEQELGVTLFRRGDRQVQLTPEGEVLLPYAKSVLQKIEDAQLAMEELKGLRKGEVRLGVPGMMGTYYFPEILMGFKTSYPQLNLTIVEAGTQAIKNMLLKGELDLGVIIDENVPDELESEHFYRSQMMAVVAPQHPLAVEPSVTFEKFFSYELAMFKTGYFHREFIDTISQTQELVPRFSFETNLLPLLLRIVRQEYAITALLELVVSHESNVVGVAFEPPKFLNLALAWRKGGYLSIAERTFIDYLKRHSDN